MQIAFTIYGIFAYSIIAALYFFIEKNLLGNKIIKGIKYGITCAVIWIVYLLEPLPHVNSIDRITYPMADSAALIVMGLLLGLFCSMDNPKMEHDKNRNILNDIFSVCCITICFAVGRVIQYVLIDIYSSFENEKLYTFLWVALTGFVIGATMLYLKEYLVKRSRIKTSLILGCMLFGIDLLLFNFFMPLVFSTDIPDLIIRTLIDIIAITIGIYLILSKDKRILYTHY